MQPHRPVKLLTTLQDWDGTLPALLVLHDHDTEQRRAALKALVSSVKGRDCEVLHREGKAPQTDGLFCSSASRGRVALVAVSNHPIGVDVERVEARELPLNVLHEREQAYLQKRDDNKKYLAFTQIWAIKEAYLKALGTGLMREPSSFSVDLKQNAIHDPLMQKQARIITQPYDVTDGSYILAVVQLDEPLRFI